MSQHTCRMSTCFCSIVFMRLDCHWSIHVYIYIQWWFSFFPETFQISWAEHESQCSQKVACTWRIVFSTFAPFEQKQWIRSKTRRQWGYTLTNTLFIHDMSLTSFCLETVENNHKLTNAHARFITIQRTSLQPEHQVTTPGSRVGVFLIFFPWIFNGIRRKCMQLDLHPLP